jgi:hypothetical protein
MSVFKHALSQLESRLQALVEASAARLFPGNTAPHSVVRGLLDAMQTSVQPGPDGRPVAPNLYILLVNPDDAERLRQNNAFLDELTDVLRQACIEAGVRLSGPLSLQIESYARLEPGQVQVVARDSLRDVTPTAGLFMPAQTDESLPANAFLIVDGTRIFLLDQPVINIGRRPDNQLVIDDVRISRLHAQLRLVRGRFIIFDLESTGGTFVNGKRIHQQVLSPGDVISLAGLPLVFGQDSLDVTDTQPTMVSDL